MHPEAAGYDGEFRVGIDIGGTFTDFVLLGADGRLLATWKEPSDPAVPNRPILRGIENLARQIGETTPALLARVQSLVHGSTIALNAVLQGSTAKVGLLATAGHRDVLYFRDGYKPERFNPRIAHPAPLVARHLRAAVKERVDRDGKAVTPLDPSSVAEAARRFAEEDVEAVAVAFLWSVVNPAHELEARAILSEAMPGVPVLLSHEIVPELRIWERTSATVLAAGAYQRVSRYLNDLEAELREQGLRQRLQVLSVGGGCIPAERAKERPIELMGSGPAGAAPATAFHSPGGSGGDAVIIDMGGTSFEVSLLVDGRAHMTNDLRVAGHPLGLRGADVNSIGAGGGSIGWVDSGGALRVGPTSAGAEPGPACYGNGGAEATVTDANLLLGRLSPDDFLGGRKQLDPALAEAAIRDRVGGPLGLDPREAAAGMLEVVCAQMADAVRVSTVKRGYDPRELPLMVGGGAAGLHVGRIAAALGIEEVLITSVAPVLCSFGMAVTPVRQEYVRPFLFTTGDPLRDRERLEALLREMKATAMREIAEAGVPEHEIELDLQVDARFQGQVHDLTVSLTSWEAPSPRFVDDLRQQFAVEHLRRFSWKEDGPIEVMHWRVVGTGRVISAPGEQAGAAASQPEPETTRQVWVDSELGFAEIPVIGFDQAHALGSVAGPAIVTSPSTTVFVEGSQTLARAGRDGTFVMTVPSRTGG